MGKICAGTQIDLWSAAASLQSVIGALPDAEAGSTDGPASGLLPSGQNAADGAHLVPFNVQNHQVSDFKYAICISDLVSPLADQAGELGTMHCSCCLGTGQTSADTQA